MSFISFEWLAWLLGTVSLYWLLPGHYRDKFLILISATFLGVHSPISLATITVLSFLSYYGANTKTISDKRIIILTLCILSILVYFKVAIYQGGDNLFHQTVIPLGLSYYSFRCFHYVFERYRETIENRTFLEFLSYMFFIPTIVIGPINRAAPFFEDREQKKWSADDISYGLERILYGYAKIAVLSGLLVNRYIVGWTNSLPPDNELLILYLGVVADGLDLYFLFAGYSDIAIGFSRLLGYRIMENFQWPYFQKNISNFWRCWHMSLTSWCRDYIYFPVVGLTRNPYLGTLATFLVIGLWHEISIRYILWGMWHAVGILLWRQFQQIKRKIGVPEIEWCWIRWAIDGGSIILTVHYVWFGLVIVSEASLSAAFDIYAAFLWGWW